MRFVTWTITILLALVACGATIAWARCNTMSSYRVVRPDFTFINPLAFMSGLNRSQGVSRQTAAARARARALRRKKTLNKIAALESLEERNRLLTIEKRRDRLEEQFARGYDVSPEQREQQALKWYEQGERAEQRRQIDAAKDFYLFAMQIAPGTTVAAKAHAALQRLDSTDGSVANASRSLDSSSTVLTQADLEAIRREAGAAFVADEIVQQMLEQLTNDSDPRKQTLIIQRLRDTKGALYSDGLLQAIDLLEGEMKEEARKALVVRFTRMTDETLRARLSINQQEAKLASIRAIARKESTALVPDLIQLISDNDEACCQAAKDTLTKITGEDFGPPPNASGVEKFLSQKRWNQWWKRQATKEN